MDVANAKKLYFCFKLNHEWVQIQMGKFRIQPKHSCLKIAIFLIFPIHKMEIKTKHAFCDWEKLYTEQADSL
jgi:hypothetical protein